MQTEPMCETCRYCKEVPFFGMTCMFPDSELYHCEIDPKEDVCTEHKERV